MIIWQSGQKYFVRESCGKGERAAEADAPCPLKERTLHAPGKNLKRPFGIKEGNRVNLSTGCCWNLDFFI